MGVADSPDLANLYGWHFERACGVLTDQNIPFYGRYIDDCIGLVYASSEHEAVQYLSNKVKFRGCVIEWGASDRSQPFLDMLIYIDKDRRLQHMPYRKARNHQERIPWISHHPLDVKRGTYIGEMSRLATLSSQLSDYLSAIQSLAALYCSRGYPSELVSAWSRKYLKERWEQRLSVRDANHTNTDDVLVLKSEFNTAWNYFNAKELGDTITGYWREWTDRGIRGELGNNSLYPEYISGHDADINLAPGCPTVAVMLGGRRVDVPDVRRLNILNKRMIVSRKRTKNLFDLTSLWKKIVITSIDKHVLDPEEEETLNLDPGANERFTPPPGSDDSDVDPWVQSYNTFGLRQLNS
jgi:hypothetical protein